DAAAIACKQGGVTHAAARLDQLRGRQIHGVHDESGRELGKRAALVGTRDQHPPMRNVAAPMDSFPPSLPPRAARTLESGQASPGAGIPPAGVPLAKGSSATNRLPRSG